MNYEKKYKELVGKIEKAYLYTQTDSTKAVLKEILHPELSEGEDERIRKDIIVLVKDWWDRVNKDNISTKEQMLAWLEKQGKQKTAEWSEEDKRSIRDCIFYLKSAKKYFEKDDNILWDEKWFDLCIAWLEKQGEQKIADKVEQKSIDDLTPQEAMDIAVAKCFEQGEQKPKWSDDDEQYLLVYKNALRKYLLSDKWDAEIINKWLEDKFKQGGQKPIIEMESAEESLGIDSETYNKIVDECIYGENKTTNKVEPKFKVGDWVVLLTSDGEKIVQINSVEYFKSGEPRYITSEGKWFGNGTKAHLWTIQDAKDGDVLSNEKMIVIFKHFEEPSYRQHIVAYIGLDRSGDIQITDDTWSLGIDKAKPATKEQRELLFQKMKEAGYEWDAEKKEIKWFEQVDSFDAELNALLKKYEHLSKKELQEPLEFYLGVVKDDLDVVRENPTHHEGWVNIFKCGLCYSVWVNIYPTKEDALNEIEGDEGDVYITTIKIEWEEQQ